MALVLVLALVGLFAWGGAAAAATLPGKIVPGSQMRGAGAFMGPARIVEANGIRIGYRQFGQGPDLLMISGDAAPMTLWLPYLTKPLAKHFTVTIFDNRGVGYSSDDLSKPISVPLMARDTAALIKVLGLDRPTVLGWSMGGEIGLTLAARHRALVGALISVSGNAGSRHTKQPELSLLRKLAHPPDPEFLLRILFPSSPEGRKAMGRFVRAYLSLEQERVSQRTLDRQERSELAFTTYNGTWEALPKIKAPVLLVNGTRDRLNPTINARRLHNRIPGSRLAIYKGAGHGALYQDVDRFVGEVISFAQERLPTPTP